MESEHHYQLIKDLSSEERLIYAFELMELVWDLRKATGLVPTDEDLLQPNWEESMVKRIQNKKTSKESNKTK